MSPTGKPRVKKPTPPAPPKQLAPWDIPPIPIAGDVDDQAIFTAVGIALSQWEYFEGYLGEIYSFLIGSKTQTSPAMRAYGSVSSFSTRIDMIRAAASSYFTIKNEPYLEELKQVLDEAKSFSPRRNDIAHGILQPFTKPSGLGPQTYALVPSRHATRRRRLEYNLKDGTLDIIYDYAYTSVEIRQFGKFFDKLANMALKAWTLLLVS
jgi:hypothetical protein